MLFSPNEQCGGVRGGYAARLFLLFSFPYPADHERDREKSDCCQQENVVSDLYSVLSNIRTGPADANAFRGHRLTTQKGYTCKVVFSGLATNTLNVGRRSRCALIFL